MTSMGMTAPSARAATRALAVLAVLLGLLAMHGLASSHHAAAATTAAATTAAQHHLAAPGGLACDQDCPDLALLCVAVLTGAALTLVMARRRSSPLLVAPACVRGPAPMPPMRHARGPDPVRELCVSRT